MTTALPDHIAFPNPGTADFEQIINDARNDKLSLGVQEDGKHLEWDLNSLPHALVCGATGAGKSVLLTSLLTQTLYNSDLFELYVCDPESDYSDWSEEFSGITDHAHTNEEIFDTIAAAERQCLKRQELLAQVGVVNIGQLREKFRQEPELEQKYGPAPRRILLVLDEVVSLRAHSADDSMKEQADKAFSNLEKIGRVGRSLGIHIFFSSQKIPALSPQIDSQLGLRICVGPVDGRTSQRIFHSDHGTRFPGGSPKGRCWAWDSKNSFRMTQGYFLPDETSPLPWDVSTNVTGAKEIIRIGQ